MAIKTGTNGKFQNLSLSISLKNISLYCKMILNHFKKILKVHPLLFTQIYQDYLHKIFTVFFKPSYFEEQCFRKAVHCIEEIIDVDD